MLLDMLTYARKVEARLQGVTHEEWQGDETLRSAVAYWMQTIGEAASRLSGETKTAHPEIAWEKMRGLRNRLVHGYGLVDSEKVWEIATMEVASLIAPLEMLVPAEPSEER